MKCCRYLPFAIQPVRSSTARDEEGLSLFRAPDCCPRPRDTRPFASAPRSPPCSSSSQSTSEFDHPPSSQTESPHTIAMNAIPLCGFETPISSATRSSSLPPMLPSLVFQTDRHRPLFLSRPILDTLHPESLQRPSSSTSRVEEGRERFLFELSLNRSDCVCEFIRSDM